MLRFYERRARRILPALIVHDRRLLRAGGVALGPAQFVSLAESAVAATLFASNVWFWQSTSGYFARRRRPGAVAAHLVARGGGAVLHRLSARAGGDVPPRAPARRGRDPRCQPRVALGRQLAGFRRPGASGLLSLAQPRLGARRGGAGGARGAGGAGAAGRARRRRAARGGCRPRAGGSLPCGDPVPGAGGGSAGTRDRGAHLGQFAGPEPGEAGAREPALRGRRADLLLDLSLALAGDRLCQGLSRRADAGALARVHRALAGPRRALVAAGRAAVPWARGVACHPAGGARRFGRRDGRDGRRLGARLGGRRVRRAAAGRRGDGFRRGRGHRSTQHELHGATGPRHGGLSHRCPSGVRRSRGLPALGRFACGRGAARGRAGGRARAGGAASPSLSPRARPCSTSCASTGSPGRCARR